MKGINSIILLIFVYGLITSAIAGTFLFAEDSETADVITHPQGYRGQGTNLIITVGISPSSLHGTEITLPIQNAITTWNQLIPTLGNVVNDEKIPFNHFDFESVVLHELGHCLGLAHPNLSSESGLSGVNRNYTQTTRGSKNRYDLNSGNDGVAGSNDDSRGDGKRRHPGRLGHCPQHSPVRARAGVSQRRPRTGHRTERRLPGAKPNRRQAVAHGEALR